MHYNEIEVLKIQGPSQDFLIGVASSVEECERVVVGIDNDMIICRKIDFKFL